MTAMLLALLLPLVAQTPKEPAHDLFMHTERAPGVELRFVDYHWRPALFAAMEKGDAAEPLATRNWVVARLILQTRPMTLGGKRLGVGNYAVGLWPNADGKGMTVEVRSVDMRELYPKINAIAPLPKGDTMYRGPARFETVEPPVERLGITLTERPDGVTVTLRYGNRRLDLVFTN
jgi:hypothetical protein